VGRAARQGDPGSYRFFLSFEDELLRAANPQQLERTRKQLTPDANGEVSLDWLPFFKKTQRLLERTHRKQRRDLMRHEKQQHELYGKIGLDRFLELTN
jgi:preprotein translocase subunit SecA